MAVLHHSIVPQQSSTPLLWETITRWLRFASGLAEASVDIGRTSPLSESDVVIFSEEVAQLRAALHGRPQDIVFAHNDLNNENIMLDESGQLRFIDFEYAGPNPRAFDIANHFCEWAADYRVNKPPGFALDACLFPSAAQQRRWLAAYLAILHPGCPVEPKTVDLLVDDIQLYALASHLMWSAWALVQFVSCTRAASRFDYLKFAATRWRFYSAAKCTVLRHPPPVPPISLLLEH